MKAAQQAYERYRVAYDLPPNVGRKAAYEEGWRAALWYLVDTKVLSVEQVREQQGEEA